MKMPTRSRLLMALAALLLVPVFYLPLWSIRIVAPQYREGLGMFIGLRDIWGHTEHDIQNINILNHYIGMRPIVPAEVDVLAIMPWAVGFLILSALLVAAIGRRPLVMAWLVTFVVLGTAGLHEFWSWNYDYGHNLSADAPIKVPGMTYQPPLIGAKTLLNFRTTSLPAGGTLFLLAAFAAAAFALYRGRSAATPGWLRSAGLPRRTQRSTVARAAMLLVAVVTAAACGTDRNTEVGIRLESKLAQPAPAWQTGGLVSDFCDGVIPDSRFGGELETADRVYRFMSAECLAGFVGSGAVAEQDIRRIRVIDYNHGERLIDARTAHYVRMQFERTPGGLDVVATETDKVAANIHYFLGGERLTWDDLLALVQREWQL